MQYYYINLDKRKERNLHFLAEIKKSKLLNSNIKRYSAVDGFDLDIKNISDKILTPESKRALLIPGNKTFGISLTHGAVGCAMSHYQLYEKCVKDDEPFLILEDDIIVDPKIDYYIEDYIEYFKYDLLYFGFHRHSHTEIKNIHPIINRIKGNIWGTFAYVVTPKFCQYAIDYVFPINIQFDSEISKHINKDKIIALAFNTNIIQAKHLGSDIQGYHGNKFNHKFHHRDPWAEVFS